LEGTLEVRDGDTIVNVLNAGEAFGEMAFLLERPARSTSTPPPTKPES
jgi:hypothetical protein